MINTKAHPNKQYYKKQFEELLNVEKMSYGIISDSNPTTKNSPLWCDVTSVQASISINYLPKYYDTIKESFNPMIHIVSNTNNEIYLTTKESNETGHFTFCFSFDILENSKEVFCVGTTQTEILHDSLKDVSISSNSYSEFEEVFSIDNLAEGKFYCDRENGNVKFIGRLNETATISYSFYENNEQNTINSIYEALLNANKEHLGIKPYNNTSSITLIGIENNQESIKTNSDIFSLKVSSRIYVKKGSAVMKSGNVVSLSKDIILNFNYTNNNLYYIVFKTDFEESEIGIDEFGEEQVKSITSKNGTVFIVDTYEENEDSICIGIFKTVLSDINIKEIDSNKELFDIRPWYSPSDVKHESLLGTGKKTPNNPHAISFNDIDSNNTLHNKLLSNVVILSKPTDRQDTCGEIKKYFIKREEVKFDSNNSIFGFNFSEETEIDYEKQTHYAYFVLPEIPLSILSIEDENGNTISGYEWLEHTSIIKVNTRNLVDFYVKYYHEKTLEPSISNEGSEVELKDVRENCVVFTEGKSITSINKIVSFKENIDKNYSVYVKKDGSFIKIPSLASSNNLNTIEGELSNLFSRNRLELIITSKNKNVLDCPFSVKCQGTTTERVEIYQSFGLYELDSNKNVYLKDESMVCPNPCVPTVSNEDDLYVICEKSSQKHIDFYEMKKDNFVFTNQENEINFISREDRYIYGGIDVDLEFIVPEERHDVFYLKIEHVNNGNSTSIEIELESISSSLTIHSDLFDEINSYGEWIVTVNKEIKVKTLSIKVNYGKIEPIIYSKIDETYTRLKELSKEGNTYEVNPYYGSTFEAKDNKDFYVSVDIVGTVNGENLTETIEFDSTYRNQKGLNSKVSNNVFDNVFKYSISESTASGKLSILAYPVGNVNNMCGIFECSYNNLNVSKLYDIRNVKPNLLYENRNVIGLTPSFSNSLFNVLEQEKLEHYFEIRNISDDHTTLENVTFYSATSFVAKIINGNSTVTKLSIEDNGIYKVEIAELPYGYSVRTQNQNITKENRNLIPYIVEIQNDDGEHSDEKWKVEIVNWDISWTSLNGLCDRMKSLSKIPSTWEGCDNIVDMKNAFIDSKILSIPRTWRSLSKVEVLENAFKNCLIKYIPNSWKGLNSVYNMKQCFENCANLKINELSFIGLDNIKNDGLYFTFCGCKINKINSFKGLEKITSLHYTFAYTELKSIPDNWDSLENVTNINGTFIDCDIEEIPKSWNGFNSVTNASETFKNCTSLKSIPESWMGLNKVQTLFGIFQNCSSVKTGGTKDAESLLMIQDYRYSLDGLTSWDYDAQVIYDIWQSIIDGRN